MKLNEFLEEVKDDVNMGWFCDNPNIGDVNGVLNILINIIERQARALESVKAYEHCYQHPEHEIRHMLAVEIPHEIIEAQQEVEALLK